MPVARLNLPASLSAPNGCVCMFMFLPLEPLTVFNCQLHRRSAGTVHITTLGGFLWACNATSLQDLQQKVHKRGLANVRTQSATVHAAAATSTPSTPVVAKDPERERLVSAVETLSRQVQRLELQQQQQQQQRQQRGSAGQSRGFAGSCFSCGEWGHRAAECRSRAAASGGASGGGQRPACHRCAQVHH